MVIVTFRVVSRKRAGPTSCRCSCPRSAASAGRSSFVETEAGLAAGMRETLDTLNATPRRTPCRLSTAGIPVRGFAEQLLRPMPGTMRRVGVWPHSLVCVDDPYGSTPTLSRGLAGYLRAVASAVGVPTEATSFEVSDTATAYLGLARRWPERPGDDLMLVWTERHGWTVAVETQPGEAPMVLAYFAGADIVPAPSAVARFVTDVVAGVPSDLSPPVFRSGARRHDLAARLAQYTESVPAAPPIL